MSQIVFTLHKFSILVQFLLNRFSFWKCCHFLIFHISQRAVKCCVLENCMDKRLDFLIICSVDFVRNDTFHNLGKNKKYFNPIYPCYISQTVDLIGLILFYIKGMPITLLVGQFFWRSPLCSQFWFSDFLQEKKML